MELRVMVESYDGFIMRWRYAVQEYVDNPYSKAKPKSKVWLTVLDSGFDFLNGYARTEEKALAKGLKKAERYCKRRQEYKDRIARKTKGTSYTSVKCPNSD